MKFRLSIACLLLFAGLAHGQHRMSNWVFGDSIIVNFNESGPILSEEKSAMRTYEVSACISDTSGNLLFYSNNIGVWNRNHEPLSGSDSINNGDVNFGSSRSNGCIFLPFPGDTLDGLFWIFMFGESDYLLRCSLIDRSLDGGLGGVVISQKNIVVLEDPISEQLAAVKHANGRDWWIIARKGYPISSSFVSVLLTSRGVQTIQEFDAGFIASAEGEISVSRDGTKIAFASGSGGGDAIVAIYDFDRCNGVIQERQIMEFDSLNKGFYGCAISPVTNIIYVSTLTFGKDKIFQVVQDGDEYFATEIYHFNFPGVPTTGNMTGQFELGPDGKIYFIRSLLSAFPGIQEYAMYLGVISNPDVIGTACELDTFGFYLGGYVNDNTHSLPNFANYDLGPLVGSPCDTLNPPDTTQTAIPVFTNPSATFTVFPSVGDGVFQVTSSISGTIQIMDLYGREWLQEQISERMSFDLSWAPAGMYVISLYNSLGQLVATQKTALQ